MKVVLIRPAKFLPYKWLVQPLGLMYIVAALRQKGFHDVHIIDMHLDQMTPEETAARALAMNPDVVGFSAMTLEYKVATQLAEIIKKANPKIHTILGGPHATTAPHDVISNPWMDFAAFHEGEETVPHLLEVLRDGGNLEDVDGIGYMKDGSVHMNKDRKLIDDLDTLPMPAWDAIEFERYLHESDYTMMTAHNRFMIMMTSRGCPYRCTYCHNIFGKRARRRSPEHVMEEISTLYNKYGIREIAIADDIFNVDAKRAEKICDLIIASGMKLKISFPSGLRGDIMEDKLIKKLKQAGTYYVAYAIETVVPRLQKIIRKGLNVEKVREAIERTNKAGIMTTGFFMFGLPTEKKEDVLATVEFALSSKLNMASFMVLQPFPGTTIVDQIKELGYEVDLDVDAVDYFKVNNKYGELDREELTALLKKANLRFSLNWRRILNTFILIPNKFNLVRVMMFFLKASFRMHRAVKHKEDMLPMQAVQKEAA